MTFLLLLRGLKGFHLHRGAVLGQDLLQQSSQQVWIYVVTAQFDTRSSPEIPQQRPCECVYKAFVCLCENHETPESAAMTTICNYLQSRPAFSQQGG